jgi:hypothetical protein
MAMKRPRKQAQPREWRVSVIRDRLTYLGRVFAPHRDAARAATVEEFGLNDEQRRRLVIQEQLSKGSS